jgi:hypothetical protein
MFQTFSLETQKRRYNTQDFINLIVTFCDTYSTGSFAGCTDREQGAVRWVKEIGVSPQSYEGKKTARQIVEAGENAKQLLPDLFKSVITIADATAWHTGYLAQEAKRRADYAAILLPKAKHAVSDQAYGREIPDCLFDQYGYVTTWRVGDRNDLTKRDLVGKLHPGKAKPR